MIDCIISGGQSGADLGGLKAAKALGIITSGYMPRGWKTEDGPRPQYEEEYGLMEHDSDDYPARTLANTMLADATIIFGKRSRGSNLTERICHDMNKPCAWIIWIPEEAVGFSPTVESNGTFLIPPKNHLVLKLWLSRNNFKILNIAGNRESKNSGIEKFTYEFLIRVLK